MCPSGYQIVRVLTVYEIPVDQISLFFLHLFRIIINEQNLFMKALPPIFLYGLGDQGSRTQVAVIQFQGSVGSYVDLPADGIRGLVDDVVHAYQIR